MTLESVFTSILTGYPSAHPFNVFTKAYALQLSLLQEFHSSFPKMLLLCNSHTKASQDPVAACELLGVTLKKAFLQGGGLNATVHLVSHWPGSFSLQSSLQATNPSPSQPRVGPKPSTSSLRVSIGLEGFAISIGHHRHHFDSKSQLSLLPEIVLLQRTAFSRNSPAERNTSPGVIRNKVFLPLGDQGRWGVGVGERRGQ